MDFLFPPTWKAARPIAPMATWEAIMIRNLNVVQNQDVSQRNEQTITKEAK